MEPMLNLAANYGFPMAVTAYLLVRIERKLELLGESINELTKVIERKG